METTLNNLCDSCTNLGCEFQSGIVRTECAFYMPPQLEPDNCGNYVVMRPPKEGLKDTSKKELTVNEEEYISKAKYEARLKGDMVAMLEELQLEIEELKNEPACCHHFVRGVRRSSEVVQQKIDALKEQTDGMV